MPTRKMNKANRKNAKSAIAAIFAALAMCAVLSAAAPAHAGDLKPGATMQTFAYAPQALQEEFPEEEYEHELNDAWLGLPVHSNTGELAGFVADAWIDENGDVSELLVDLRASGHEMAVYVAADLLALSQAEIGATLSIGELARLEQDDAYIELASN